MLTNVNKNLNSRGCPMWSWGFVWSRDFEKIGKGQWAQVREIKTI